MAVNIGELFTEEVLRSNTLGTLNCMGVYQKTGARKAIFLSIAKAGHPIKAYGMSKTKNISVQEEPGYRHHLLYHSL